MCWDQNVEKNYPNLIDLQHYHYEITGRMKLGLSTYAKMMGVVDKVDFSNYGAYDAQTLSSEAI